MIFFLLLPIFCCCCSVGVSHHTQFIAGCAQNILIRFFMVVTRGFDYCMTKVFFIFLLGGEILGDGKLTRILSGDILGRGKKSNCHLSQTGRTKTCTPTSPSKR
jgi:hypothetical protein